MTHLDDLLTKSHARVISDLKPGDILHVRVGVADVGDGYPWIPTQEDLDAVREEFVAKVPDGVEVVTTHFGVDAHTPEINFAVFDLRDEETESKLIQYLRDAGIPCTSCVTIDTLADD